MKLSDKTISLLKNFAGINRSILFREGNQLRTISVMKNILAEVTIEEDFERDFGIYDLNQFLNALSLYQNPQLNFDNDNYVVISEGNAKSKYFFADPAVIVTPPDKSISLPSEDVCFEVTTQQLDRLLKASSVYGVPDLSVVGNGETVSLVVHDKKNDLSNQYSLDVGETTDTFTLNFKVENIVLMPGAYEVVISKRLLSRFEREDKNLTYYIALEPDSVYND